MNLPDKKRKEEVAPPIPNGGDEKSLTTRDYFAAAALQGLLANGGGTAEGVAVRAYVYADAMLKARG